MVGHVRIIVALVGVIAGVLVGTSGLPGQEPNKVPATSVSKEDAIQIAVKQLLEIQNPDGAWPYEGVYRVQRKIPVGYRIGGTAICCQALLYATDAGHGRANAAIESGVEMILKELDDPLMRASQEDRYDVRVWGHIYTLDLMGRLKHSDRFPELESTIDTWIPKLTKTLVAEEIGTGGWNYANHRAHAAFVTAPAIQALMWARQSGETIPDEVWSRAAEAILRSRNDDAAFAYSGDERARRPTQLPGSIARSANCEATLGMMGLGRQQATEHALVAFHKYWDELEKRRKKTGTHKPPYGIAPYYFYYGHRYAAMAVSQLPERKRAAEYERLFQVILKTRDSDGTWNDRVFARSRAYGTAMMVLALLEEQVPQPTNLNVVELDSDTFEEKTGLVRLSVAPELLTPKLLIQMSDDLSIEWEEQKSTLGEIEAWFKGHPSTKQYNCIVITVDGKTKTGDVERLKAILARTFGRTSIYIDVAEDESTIEN